MTVQELIDKLLQYEPDRQIFFWSGYDGEVAIEIDDEIIWEND